jgi:hypothetical protein
MTKTIWKLLDKCVFLSSVNLPNFSFFWGETFYKFFNITKLKKKTLEFVNVPFSLEHVKETLNLENRE